MRTIWEAECGKMFSLREKKSKTNKDRKFLAENSVRTDLILYFPKSDRFIQDEIQASPESYRFIQDEFSHVLYVCC